MLPGHEIDRNLPLRRFFLALVDRALELSRSDAPTRHLLEEFADATGVAFEGTGWRSLSRQVVFASEISKEMSYGVLAIKHFVELLEYATVNPEEVKTKDLTDQFRAAMEDALYNANKMARYANPMVLETFDFNNVYKAPVGQNNEPIAH